jgi:hypothetical protein
MRSTDLLLPMVPACLLSCRDMASPIRTWLQDGDFELDSASSGSTIPVIRNATRSFEPTLAREVDRFLCAMGESFAEVQPSRFASRSIGWALIRAYYASYFAAHALLRMTGRCITQVDGALSNSMMRSLQTNGLAPPWQIGNALYVIRYDEAQQLLLFEDKHNAKGGSHQFVWKKLGELLNELINSCRTLGAVYQAEVVLFERMADTLTSQQTFPDHSWLSSIRNSVNYGFAHSVWFPFEGMDSRHSSRLINLLSCTSSQDAFTTNQNTQSDLEKFCEATSFLVSFANSAANLIVRRSGSRPFLSRSFLKLQRLLDLPR